MQNYFGLFPVCVWLFLVCFGLFLVCFWLLLLCFGLLLLCFGLLLSCFGLLLYILRGGRPILYPSIPLGSLLRNLTSISCIGVSALARSFHTPTFLFLVGFSAQGLVIPTPTCIGVKAQGPI